jgi:hypothetical protein
VSTFAWHNGPPAWREPGGEPEPAADAAAADASVSVVVAHEPAGGSPSWFPHRRRGRVMAALVGLALFALVLSFVLALTVPW